jgi:protease YdgD
MTPARLLPALLLAAAPAFADPAERPGLAPLSHTASLAAVARIRSADETRGGCTAVLIAPDVALTAGHCARGSVSGPRAMRLTFRPDRDAFAVTVRAVAFHADRDDSLTFASAHADLALLRLAMPVPPDIARPIPLATDPQAEAGALYGYRNDSDDALHGHTACQIATARPELLVSDCRVVSGFSGAPLLSGTPGDWRVEGIAVATVFGQPYRALIADVVPWPPFAGPYALDKPPTAPPSPAPQTSP